VNNELDNDLKSIVAIFFAANVHSLLADPKRLESLARMANIPAERVPAIRAALHAANSTGLAS
jgi:hypothetical protein